MEIIICANYRLSGLDNTVTNVLPNPGKKMGFRAHKEYETRNGEDRVH